MPATITHTFVSAIADGADTTLVRPVNWNASHTVDGFGYNSYEAVHLNLTGTERLVITGTNEVVVGGPFGRADSLLMGVPKTLDISFTVPNNYVYDQFGEIAITQNNRVTLQGSADFYLTDDFAARSRIVLAGRGGGGQ